MEAHSIPWGPIRSLLRTEFSFGKIKEIVGYTGVDMTRMAHLEQRARGGASLSQLLSAIDQQIGEADSESKARIVAICCEEILRRRQDLLDELDQVLSRVGWRFVQGHLVPLEIFDASELQQLPTEAHEDLVKAARRLRDGDLSGALSSACSAIDSVTNTIYGDLSLGDPGKASFQEKVKKSIAALNVQTSLEKELDSLGWDEAEITLLNKNLVGSLNQAAYVMQTLRSKMGDVHGTKRVVTALVYDSLKWAALLLRLFTKQ